MAERRRSVRAVARIEVYDKDKQPDRVPLYVSGNVSAGGIFLITQEPFARDTNLMIKFTLPDDDHPIEAVGTVVWVRSERHSPERPPGMGVQFMEIPKHDRERIRKFVEEQALAGNEAPED